MPYLGSLILTHSLDGEIKGLKEFKPEDRPPVAIPFFAFRIMVTRAACNTPRRSVEASGSNLTFEWKISSRAAINPRKGSDRRRVDRLPACAGRGVLVVFRGVQGAGAFLIAASAEPKSCPSNL